MTKIKTKKLLLGLMMLGLGLAWSWSGPTVQAAACTSSGNFGAVTFSGGDLTLPSPGTYYLWARINVTAAGNGFELEVNGDICIPMTTTTPNQWMWVNANQSTYNFTATTGNSLRMLGLNPNVKVDQLVLTTDPTCVPNDFGNNCGVSVTNPGGTGDNGPAQGTLSAPPLGPVSGKANPSLTLATVDKSVVQKVEYYADNHKLQTSNGAEPLDTTLLANGSHPIETKIYFTDGTTKTDHYTIEVNNKQSLLSPLTRWVRVNQQAVLIIGASVGGLIVLSCSFFLIKQFYLHKRLMNFHGF